jgi:DNA-nicking Smr family endonuclease
MTRRMPLDEQLGVLKATLVQRAQEEAARREREAEAARREQAQREQFSREIARTMGPVQRLLDKGRALRTPTAVAPIPRQRIADEAQALASSLSDDLDVTTLLDTDADLAFRREGIGPDVLSRLRRGHWSVQRHLDLHGMTREVAREALSQFIRRAERDGLRCVRVVHGKGNGSPGREPVLKGKVRAWLVQKCEVLAFAQASASDGGHGAVLVLLRG